MRNIIQKIRTDLVNTPEVQAIVGARVFPQRVDLEQDTGKYPSIAFSFIGGFPDRDNYEYNNQMLEFMFISDKSIDESIKTYEAVNSLLNKKYYVDPDIGLYFRVTEDSKPIDFSGVFGNNILYIYTNTYRLRVIG